MKKFRTEAEQQVGANIARIFEACPDSVETKLENFPKYVRRQHLKRFLAMYEIFKLALPVKGSIVECGVFKGFGVDVVGQAERDARAGEPHAAHLRVRHVRRLSQRAREGRHRRGRRRAWRAVRRLA